MAKAKQKQSKKANSKASGAAVKAKSKAKRHELVRKEIMEKYQEVERGYIDLARLLHEAYHKEFYREWGFKDFEEYITTELGMQYRKAMYFVDIWEKVKALNLSKPTVEKLGWAKMKDLVRVINEENAQEWIEKAEKMSSRELTEAVKVTKRKDLSGVEVPTITTWRLKMSEAEANVITEAVEEAKKLLNTDNTVVALEMICQDWMADRGASPKRTPLKDMIAFIEQAYGVNLIVADKETSMEVEKAEDALDAVDDDIEELASGDVDEDEDEDEDEKNEEEDENEEGLELAESLDDVDEDEIDLDELLGLTEE